jgi:hypothetical protein
MSELYNPEFKEQFLSKYPEQTQKTYANMFSKATSAEKLLEKDLYEFNLNEIAKVIKNANPKTTGVAKSIGRYISTYINFALFKGKIPNRDNELKAVPSEWYEQFVDKTKKLHFSYDELFEPVNGILDKLRNAQDQAFIALMFEGVLGQSFVELQLLHYNHINWNTNEIQIHDDNGFNRTITVSDQVMKYVENAYKQPTYFTYVPDTDEFNERELMHTDFVFRNTKSPRVVQGEPVSQAVFYNRIKNIKGEIVNDFDYITPNAIRQSGMIKMAVDLIKDKIERGEEPKITYQDVWKKIGEKFNFATFDNNGQIYFNTNLLKESVNESTIKSLYNLDVII